MYVCMYIYTYTCMYIHENKVKNMKFVQYNDELYFVSQ